MAFSTNCTNKGCGKQQEPYLDPKTDKVYCSMCDGELTNLTYFAKAQMKSSKQFRQKSKVAFAFKCEKCNKEDRPENLKGEIVCKHCKKPMDNLSKTFKEMLKEKLKTVDKEV